MAKHRKPLRKQPLFYPTVAMLVLAGALTYAERADAAESGRITEGTGWKAETSDGITALDPSRTYVITFTDEASRKKLAAGFETAVKQLQELNLKIFITTTVETVPEGKCPPKDHFVVGRKYRPLGKGGFSQAQPCYSLDNHSAFSARIWIDSEYKQLGGAWSIADTIYRNTYTHELGHALGLDHANQDVNGDGKVADYEAVETSYGNTPVMTSPNGGYTSKANNAKFGYRDLQGLTQLVNNFKLAP